MDFLINRTVFQKFLVSSDSGHHSIVKHNDLICMTDGRGPLRYDKDYRIALHLPQCFSKRCIGCKIQCRRTVIQDQDSWMAHQCSCNGQSLSLSARQVLAALIDLCLQSICSLSYKLCRLCCLQSLPQLFFRGVLLAPAQIVFNSSFEKHRFLWHKAVAS